MSLWCELEGLAELERCLPDADGALSDGTRNAVARAVDEGAKEARETHRYKDRSGNLTRETKGVVEVSTPGGATGTITANTPYASYVDGGTAAHDIHPKAGAGFVGPLPKGQSRGRGNGGGVLRFQIGGQWVSASVVHHPGTKPDGFLGRAYLKAERVAEREVEVAVAKAQQIIER